MGKKRLALFSYILILISTLLYAAKYSFDFSAFVAAPQHLVSCAPEHFTHIRSFQDGGGDGGYNYLAAQDPFLQKYNELPNCAKEAISYTKERFLYHFLSWAISLGNLAWLHYAMLIANLLALGAITIYSYKMAVLKKIPDYCLPVLILSVGIWQPLRFNAVDLVWSAALISAFYYFESKQMWKLGIALTFAMLTRSYSIGVVFALFAVNLIERRSLSHFLPLLLAVSVYYGPFKLWQNAHISSTSQVFNGESFISLPFSAFFKQWLPLITSGNGLTAIVALAGFLFFLSVLILTLWLTYKSRKIHYEAIIIVGYCSLIFILANVAWSNSLIQLGRVLMPTLFCLVFLIQKTDPRYLRVVIPSLYLVSFAGFIWFAGSETQILISWAGS